MKIKGVKGSIPNELYAEPAEDDAQRTGRETAPGGAGEEEKARFGGTAAEVKLRNLQEEMKKVQTDISSGQIYLEHLEKASRELKEERDPDVLFREMERIGEEARFRDQRLMEPVLPRESAFYKNEENLQKLSEKLEKEIATVKSVLGDSQQQLNRFSVSAENIHASLSPGELLQMKEVFSGENLYKRFNSDIVISLIQ